MKAKVNIGLYLLCSFFAFTLGIAFLYNRNYPVLAVASEPSVGTWISGVLLSCCAAFAVIIATQQKRRPWVLASLFFFLLAADEHFMSHERVKEWIIFSFSEPPIIIRELPVIAGALIGALVSWHLRNHMHTVSRKFLASAVFLGSMSVVLDITGSAAMWEECLKLLAELSIACALLIYASPAKDNA